MANQINFNNLNSLIFKQPVHRLATVKPSDKNLELQFIVLQCIQKKIKTKMGNLYKFHIADHSASAYINVFDEVGQIMIPSDIFYINGAYSTLYKDKLILYQGKQCILRKLGNHFFEFNTQLNISQIPYNNNPTTISNNQSNPKNINSS